MRLIQKRLRSSHSEVLLRKGVLKICSKFTEEYPCRNAISIKLLCNFIEIALRHLCSAVNLLHIFRIPFHKNTSGWLLLKPDNPIHYETFFLKGFDISFCSPEHVLCKFDDNVYLKPSRKSTMKLFCEKLLAVNYFRKNISIAEIQMGSTGL